MLPKTSRGPSGFFLTSGALFCLFLGLFLLFPSHDYTSVDGALRCLEVFHRGSLYFHENNHLLYPAWVLLWTTAAHSLGIVARSPFEFIRITQAMNALLGAAAIAILYDLLGTLTGSRRTALLCSFAFGLSTAVVHHATNSAEVMPGLFWSLLGVHILLTGLRRNSVVQFLSAGLCFALALASYQAMASIAGVGAFACVWWLARQENGIEGIRPAVVALLWVTLGGLAGVFSIYGFAYSRQGIPIAEMPRQFFSLISGSATYAGLSVSRLVNVPFGLARNLFNGIPSDYEGIRSLIRHPARSVWIPVVVLGLAMLSTIAALVTKALFTMARECTSALIVTGCGACMLLAFPLLYWDPVYDKLWLLPIAAAASAVAISLRPGALPSIYRNILGTLVGALVIVQAGVNVPSMLRNHAAATPYLSEAEGLNRLVTPRDWIILDFDDVSSLWWAIWGYDTKSLLLPASTAATAKKWLDTARQDCERSGARMLFVSVLDHDRKTWDGFLGTRVGIPFDMLDEYRTQSTVLKSYPGRSGTIVVRQYRPGASGLEDKR